MAGNFVIAGGSKGIGHDLVQRLSGSADQIHVLSRQKDELQINENIHHHPFDFLTDDCSVLQLPDQIHGIAYCPGSINLRSFRSLKIEDFRADLEINLMGAIKLLQSCQKSLKQSTTDGYSASVVLFSTVAVGKGMSMHASVAAAKGAVEGLTRSLAAEWAPAIRVNCIAPALTDTPLAEKFFRSEDSKNAMAAKYPLKRTGTTQDISAMAEFLMRPESSWITGQVLGIDGGMSTLAAI